MPTLGVRSVTERLDVSGGQCKQKCPPVKAQTVVPRLTSLPKSASSTNRYTTTSPGQRGTTTWPRTRAYKGPSSARFHRGGTEAPTGGEAGGSRGTARSGSRGRARPSRQHRSLGCKHALGSRKLLAARTNVGRSDSVEADYVVERGGRAREAGQQGVRIEQVPARQSRLALGRTGGRRCGLGRPWCSAGVIARSGRAGWRQ